jgi:hypothetical protein
MTDVLALDVATTLGWCRGIVGAQPTAGSVCFGRREMREREVYGNALIWFSDFLRPEPRPDLVILESMLAIGAMDGQSQRATWLRLAGLRTLAIGVAHARNIPEIAEASVQDIRGHFIGERNMRRREAKSTVMERCKRLGWEVRNDNEGDAAALWSYACSLIDPRLAMNVVPLFNRRLSG